MAKSWYEKLHNGRSPVVEVLDKPFAGLPPGSKMLISTPLEVQELVQAIPYGQSRSTADIRGELAKRHGAETTCPLTTGIFLRIVAEATLADMEEGKEPGTPFWRAIDPKSPVAKKLSCGVEFLKARRAAEGISS